MKGFVLHRIAQFTATALFTGGLLLLLYAATLNPYTNADEFNEKYTAIGNTTSDSQSFFELRDSYLTPKYILEDYGFTLLVLSFSLWFAFRKRRKPLKIFKGKTTVTVVGLMAVLGTTAAIAGDLFLEMARGGVPYWADTIIIPLMSIPPIFLVLLIWFAIQLFGLLGSYKTGSIIETPKINFPVVWYGVQLLGVCILTGILIYEGAFLLVAAGILWITFFLNLMIGRSTTRVISMTEGQTMKSIFLIIYFVFQSTLQML